VGRISKYTAQFKAKVAFEVGISGENALGLYRRDAKVSISAGKLRVRGQ